MRPGFRVFVVFLPLIQQKTSYFPALALAKSRDIMATKHVICMMKFMLRAPAAYRAKAFTAGMSDNAPRKNAADFNKKIIVNSGQRRYYLLKIPELHWKQTLMGQLGQSLVPDVAIQAHPGSSEIFGIHPQE